MMVTVSSKGQVVLPAELRRKYGIEAGTRLGVVDMAGVMYLVPVKEDPLAELRGMFRDSPGLSSAEAAEERRRDRKRESVKWSLE